VKPVQSAGTDDVFLCTSFEEAEVAFSRILGKINGLGLVNESVLVQEFLVGKEYVVDKVSRDGVHKVVAIWEYDKRPVNGANFVYYGMRLMPTNTPKCQQMIAYADKVLDALGINQGPSHMEIMYNEETGPCLVEVGCRCQGGEGTWLASAMECIGFTQVTVTLDVYTEGKFFAAMDKDNYVLKKAGREVDMVSMMGGVVRSMPGEEVIRKLPSFRSMSWDVKPGDYAPKTIDCFTRPGCVQLVHESEEQADADFEAIHALDACGLMDFSVICPTPPVTGAVVIVDPFSSGAHLAAMVVKWGFKLILVFSERDSPVAALISKGANNFKPTLLIQHDATNPDQDAAVEETLSQLRNQEAPVLAILPGAETGVELTEMLAARLGTRNNGEEMTFARRNKYAMQEAIRAKNIRAVKQKLCMSEDDVREFVKTIVHPVTGKIKCVVKPNESAGTDSVFLCNTVEEAIAGFRAIDGHANGLGHQNYGALCQEFLTGTEFVIDGVSRDGVYKVVAIWEYDKRSVNGANFVYFGMFLRGAETERERALIAYAKQVVSALGILQGPSHMEVMFDPATGPCLVEVGSRCHGGEGTWLPVVNECLGYSQLDATLSAYIRPDRFDALPMEPLPLKHGAEAFLVSHTHGVLKDIPGSDEIRSMPSFRRMELLTQPGSNISPTIDCFTRYQLTSAPIFTLNLIMTHPSIMKNNQSHSTFKIHFNFLRPPTGLEVCSSSTQHRKDYRRTTNAFVNLNILDSSSSCNRSCLR
jgi:biotin carboxylase